MFTVAVLVPRVDGLNVSSKVVELVVGIEPTAGCILTVKSAASAPVMVTLGLPVRFKLVLPRFSMVKMRLRSPD